MKINLVKPWTYRTSEMTVDYPAGEHEVSAAIGAAYTAEQGNDDGNGDTATGSPRAARKT